MTGQILLFPGAGSLDKSTNRPDVQLTPSQKFVSLSLLSLHSIIALKNNCKPILKTLRYFCRQTYKDGEEGDTLTWRLQEARSSDFCCQLDVPLTFQLLLTLLSLLLHRLRRDPGGDLSGGNKLRGAIICPVLLLLFLTWQSICEGHKAWALCPTNVPACQYLLQAHKRSADSQSIPYFIFVYVWVCSFMTLTEMSVSD